MVRMSDIFRHKEEPQKPEEEKQVISQKPETKSPPEPEEAIKFPRQEEEKSQAAGISLQEASSAIIDRVKLSSRQETEVLYNDMLTFTKDILDKGARHEPIDGSLIQDKVGRVIDQIALGNDELIDLVNSPVSKDYIYAHNVNVCILAIKLGFGFGYNKSKLIELGTAALLYDIGMIKFMDIAQKKGKLSDEEYEQIKKHPLYGAKILEAVRDISKVCIYVASDHHERVDGSGYPEGKKGDQINEYARLIAVVDSYEALTHARAYGSKLSPYQAIKIILEDKEKYDERFIKLLIEQISLYPIGSWVRLSTNEIGRVIHIDKASPLKPTVKIFFDPEGTKLPEAKAIDIAKHPSAYIKKAMDDGEIKSLLAETA